jgi:hypothetical protein
MVSIILTRSAGFKAGIDLEVELSLADRGEAQCEQNGMSRLSSVPITVYSTASKGANMLWTQGNVMDMDGVETMHLIYIHANSYECVYAIETVVVQSHRQRPRLNRDCIAKAGEVWVP